MIFIGSKKLGLEVLAKIYELNPKQLKGVITFDDSNDVRTKLDSFPSFLLVTPRASPISPNTRHATGIENLRWISIIGLCGDSPSSRRRSTSVLNSERVNSG